MTATRPPLGWVRLSAMAAVMLAAGGAIGWLYRPEPKPVEVVPPPPRIVIAGEELPSGGDPVADALDLVRRFSRNSVLVKLPDGTSRELRPAVLGAEIDRARLAEVVRAAMDPKSPLGREYEARRAENPEATLEVPIPIRISAESAVEPLAAIKDEIDKAPIDAMVDLEKKELRPERIGFRLDVYGTLARIDAALREGRREVEAAVDTIAPRVAASQLGNVKFDQVLGYFETRYALGARHAARTYNLRLAASKLDGTVLLPGEEFDFNGTVGPRDEANGYKVAPVIAEGELVDGIGGGTCQISGTLHGAAFFAGLDVVERVPHSRPSSYIKLGLDAAVAYPTINYKLRNNFDFPVVLHETVKNGIVRAEILGPKRKRTVSFFRRIDDVVPFEEVERESPDLPEGKRVLTQRGVPGFRTSVIRVVREGAYAWHTKHRTRYPATTQIVRVGTGPEGAEGKVKQDLSPEYRADERLVVTQGPDIRTPGVKEREPGGGTVESREPGRFGSPGWQKKLGMKVFEEERAKDEESRDG